METPNLHMAAVGWYTCYKKQFDNSIFSFEV